MQLKSLVALTAATQALALALATTPARANVWVFEPSVALDQRFDDNYRLYPTRDDGISSTRLVGSLGLSREANNQEFSGLLRIDGLLTSGSNDLEDLSSNQILYLDSKWHQARQTFALGLNFRRDTPNRDIAADITDISTTAADTGASNTQEYNQPRQRLMINPNYTFRLSRRSDLSFGVTYTDVTHEAASVQELLAARYLLVNPDADTIPDNLDIEDVGGDFIVVDELEDYNEAAVSLRLVHQLSPIVRFTANLGYAKYQAEVNPDANVNPYEFTRDSREPGIQYKNKRDSISDTATVRLGLERNFTQTLVAGIEIGGYSTRVDESDLLRPGDGWIPDPIFDPNNPLYGVSDEERRALREAELAPSTETGWLAALTATQYTGSTRFSGRIGVDVYPSDVGSQVESFQAVGDLVHTLSPLLEFSFRARAYEPDVISAVSDDEYARRFISFEPKLTWEINRAWTVATSYRYRRQKSRAALRSGESNALLFSIKYTPPSAIRDNAGN